MTNAEKLAEAREFTESPNLGKDMARELDKALIYIRELADIAEAAEARAKGFEANFPCDGACNYDSGPEENCSLHGRNPADLWGIIANTSAELYEAEARIAELEAGEWQYSYYEKWADGSGVHERVTFRTLAEARKWFDNSGDMSGWNAEVKKKDRLVAGIEKRRVVEPGTWVPVESEGE